jgi:hypothetical protein
MFAPSLAICCRTLLDPLQKRTVSEEVLIIPFFPICAIVDVGFVRQLVGRAGPAERCRAQDATDTNAESVR